MCHDKEILVVGDIFKPVTHKLKDENMFILPLFQLIWNQWTFLLMSF